MSYRASLRLIGSQPLAMHQCRVRGTHTLLPSLPSPQRAPSLPATLKRLHHPKPRNLCANPCFLQITPLTGLVDSYGNSPTIMEDGTIMLTGGSDGVRWTKGFQAMQARGAACRGVARHMACHTSCLAAPEARGACGGAGPAAWL